MRSSSKIQIHENITIRKGVNRLIDLYFSYNSYWLLYKYHLFAIKNPVLSNYLSL